MIDEILSFSSVLVYYLDRITTALQVNQQTLKYLLRLLIYENVRPMQMKFQNIGLLGSVHRLHCQFCFLEMLPPRNAIWTKMKTCSAFTNITMVIHFPFCGFFRTFCDGYNIPLFYLATQNRRTAAWGQRNLIFWYCFKS